MVHATHFPVDAENIYIYRLLNRKLCYQQHTERDNVICYQFQNAYLTINSDRCPVVDYNLSFANQKFSRVYGVAALFGVKFFSMDELITRSNITPSDFKTLYPLITFDVSKQKEKLKSSVVDIYIEAHFTENVLANTRAFALVIADKILSLKSDGNKMSVIY